MVYKRSTDVVDICGYFFKELITVWIKEKLKLKTFQEIMWKIRKWIYKKFWLDILTINDKSTTCIYTRSTSFNLGFK